MSKKIVWLIISCLMVLTLLVTSCGEASTDEGEDINGEEENGTTEEEEEEEGEEQVVDDKDMVLNTAGKLVEKPRQGGWYYARISSDFRGFDDILATSSQWIIPNPNLTHDELYTGDWSKGSQGTGETSWTIEGTYFPHLQVPALATSYELPDNETIIWHIRQGVHWHDKPPANGREFNAHDAVFNLNRAFFTPGSFLGDINFRQDKGDGPTSIKALDDWTIEMKVPPHMQANILFDASDYIYMQCPELIEEYGDASNWEVSLGTGPFMLTDYVSVSSATFERNPNYWMKNPLHPEDQLPYIDGVKFLIIPDSSTALAAFRTGKLETRTVGDEDWEALRRTNPELLWDRQMPTTCSVIYMRQDNPDLPQYDVRVRKALYYAIDHHAIIDDYYDGEAEMIVAPISNLPEFSGMFTPLEEYSEEVQKLYGYYPEEAKQLLEDAGYPDGFECTMLSSSEGILPVIKDMWSKVGVTMNIDVRTSAVVNTLTTMGRHEDMFYYGMYGRVVLKLHQWRPESYLNYSKVNDEEFNEWFEEFNNNLLDWDKLCTMLKEMEPKMRARAYEIYLPAGYTYFMWWPWLKGWHGETNVGYWNTYEQFTYIWIDKDLRKEMTGREN